MKKETYAPTTRTCPIASSRVCRAVAAIAAALCYTRERKRERETERRRERERERERKEREREREIKRDVILSVIVVKKLQISYVVKLTTTIILYCVWYNAQYIIPVHHIQ